MPNEMTNGISALATANLIVLLLALNVTQYRRKNPGLQPLVITGFVVLALHAILQSLAIIIATSFIPDTRSLIGWAAVLGLVPTVWCLILLNDGFVAARAEREELQNPSAGPPVLNMEMARKYVAWGDYENAKRAYLAFYEKHPRSAEPLLGLEALYSVQGKYRDAANVCEQIMNAFDHDVIAWTTAALRLIELYETRLGRPADAAELHDEVVRKNPGIVRDPSTPEESEAPLDEAQMNEAIANARSMAQRGEREASLQLLKKLRTSNPRDPRPLFESALILEADKQTDAARRTLETAVREFSSNPGVWSDASFRLAEFQVNRFGNVDAARELIQRVADRAPEPHTRALAREKLDKLDNPWA